MKIALSSYTAMGAWFVLRLMSEGHDVDYYLSEEKYQDVLSGLIPKPIIPSIDHRRSVLGYGFPSYKKYDLSLFDLTGRAKWAESSRLECPTLGDGEFHHALEDDREFGLIAMESCGINVPPYTKFTSPAEAKSFIKSEKKRFVYKPFTVGGSTQDSATTYVSKDQDDLLEYIDNLWERSKRAPFILQEFIEGKEIGVEAFFNGKEFFLPIGCIEEKKFMNDNKGPNTGCSGNLIFAMHDDMKLYKEGLLKSAPLLEYSGFKGMIDLAVIATEDKIYALEWTPRYGYLCCPSIAAMYGRGYGDLLFDIASGDNPDIKWTNRYALATTITIPPYPTEINVSKEKAQGIPIEGIDPSDIEQLNNTYLFDAMLKGKKLVTAGCYGYIGGVIGTGGSIGEADAKMLSSLKNIQIPNCQYRTDIAKVTWGKYDQLFDWGWIR